MNLFQQALKGAHESRNSLVARVLRENFKVMRELGEGMRRIFQVMSDSELGRPILLSGEHHFAVTLENKSSFTAQQEQWLMMFQQFHISPLQKRILLIGMGDREISPADIYKAIGKDRDTYDKEVTKLRNAGLLVEIRTGVAARHLSETKRIPRHTISRFRVQIPGVSIPTIHGEAKNFQLGRPRSKKVHTGGPSASPAQTYHGKTSTQSKPIFKAPVAPPVRREAIDLRQLLTRPTKEVKTEVQRSENDMLTSKSNTKNST